MTNNGVQSKKLENTWIDITQPFTNTIGTWPGDTPFRYELSYLKEQTGSVNIGRFTTSTHTGTHADAPFHFDSTGPSIEAIDVNIYIGDALVVDVTGHAVITPELLQHIDLSHVQRLLLKTSAHVNVEQFPTSIPVVDPSMGLFLKVQGIILLGLDIPSVDALDSKEVAAHHALYLNGVHIVENLLLQSISPGLYEFIGLPLKIVGADGAPLRAVLRKKIINNHNDLPFK